MGSWNPLTMRALCSINLHTLSIYLPLRIVPPALLAEGRGGRGGKVRLVKSPRRGYN